MTLNEYTDYLLYQKYFNLNRKYIGEDIHILRNNTNYDLSQYFSSHPDVTLEYTPVGVIGNLINGTTFNFNSISLHKDTGVINANTISGSNVLRNFTLALKFTIQYTDENNNASTDTTFREYIRVHIHDSVSRIWLTPTPLTIRKDEFSQVKFHVYAEFNDGLADVSSSPQVNDF